MAKPLGRAPYPWLPSEDRFRRGLPVRVVVTGRGSDATQPAGCTSSPGQAPGQIRKPSVRPCRKVVVADMGRCAVRSRPVVRRPGRSATATGPSWPAARCRRRRRPRTAGCRRCSWRRTRVGRARRAETVATAPGAGPAARSGTRRRARRRSASSTGSVGLTPNSAMPAARATAPTLSIRPCLRKGRARASSAGVNAETSERAGDRGAPGDRPGRGDHPSPRRRPRFRAAGRAEVSHRVPEGGLEPPRPKARQPKCRVSADSTTLAGAPDSLGGLGAATPRGDLSLPWASSPREATDRLHPLVIRWRGRGRGGAWRRGRWP